MEDTIKKVGRMDYRHICADQPYAPELFFPAVNEAINVFLKKERGAGDHKYKYDELHPLYVFDLREIAGYVNLIWSNREIYYTIEE